MRWLRATARLIPARMANRAGIKITFDCIRFFIFKLLWKSRFAAGALEADHVLQEISGRVIAATRIAINRDAGVIVFGVVIVVAGRIVVIIRLYVSISSTWSRWILGAVLPGITAISARCAVWS